jgi:hypothetical protein
LGSSRWFCETRGPIFVAKLHNGSARPQESLWNLDASGNLQLLLLSVSSLAVSGEPDGIAGFTALAPSLQSVGAGQRL